MSQSLVSTGKCLVIRLVSALCLGWRSIEVYVGNATHNALVQGKRGIRFES